MLIDECFQLGQLVKAHGLKGHLVAHLDCDEPNYYRNLESVLLELSGNLIPFFIKDLNIQGTKAILLLDEVDTVEKALELTNKPIYLPLSALPPLDSDQFYYHELIGYLLFDGEKEVGVITAIYQPSSQYLAAIEKEGKEILIPLESGIILSVDKDVKQVRAALPEGLVDIYLSDNP